VDPLPTGQRPDSRNGDPNRQDRRFSVPVA
jgi:hypothetical protein